MFSHFDGSETALQCPMCGYVLERRVVGIAQQNALSMMASYICQYCGWHCETGIPNKS